MVGISLSQEQIRSAPPEVRHWIEQQVAGLFANPAATDVQPVSFALAACTIEEARAILEQIQTLLPVVSVFFELGRETAGMAAGEGIRSIATTDIQRHARLRSPEQVAQCVDVINQILAAMRGDPKAMICAFDQQGRCYVTDATAHNILALWHDIVASRGLQQAPQEEARGMPVTAAA